MEGVHFAPCKFPFSFLLPPFAAPAAPITVLEQRPSDTQAFARETFCHRNLKEQVDQVYTTISSLHSWTDVQYQSCSQRVRVQIGIVYDYSSHLVVHE